ncbi:TPA: hypothetical protein MAO83_002421 [Klebsiella pneumoniae]|uniref:hypothetical protein n=1 Tax=Klebsiella pneumoniae TaxID=573 RepID=UPI001CBAF8B2|nr:hypothetical protein [Klebsiella pneumoniae]EKJ7591916.1 hypothetical protein [Klebsiella pneumoniae]MBZ1674584.1 hypothetical protein [Klebsiella pneumoniae]MEB5985020.1 hypothetical protein [Klebsiella pneumoniae]HBR3491809.1 hypothetical protein [Klebsiella pneumoniae]HBS7166517.1 hypothetical protein [Klebsiella pneumoniae]
MTSKFTREELLNIIDTDHVQCGEASALARMALAAMDSEPVAVIDQANLDYLLSGADADVWPPQREEMGDVLLYRHAQPAPEYPETLPCPVLLEPGLRFGKGIKTSTMLAALARRAVHESDMAALSPEERAEFQARIEDCKALIAQPVPVISADLLHTAASAIEDLLEHTDPNTSYYSGVWADVPGKLRVAMLQAGNHTEQLLDMADHSGDATKKAVNSPVIPEGWTGNDKANAALMMLDRIETIDHVDDDRIDGIKRIVRELAAAPQGVK